MKRISTLNYCEADYKHYHCWERIGINGVGEMEFIYYRCSQCNKYKKEPIVFVKGGEK